MCVAAIIFKPVPLDELQAMDDDNPHGAGVAWAEDGELHFERGLGAQEIWDLQRTRLTFPYLLHFRWATHGDIVPELTHPVPVGPRALFGELSGVAPKVLIHNGVWNDYLWWCLDGSMPEMPSDVLDCQSDTTVLAWVAGVYPEALEGVPWAVATAEIGPDGGLWIETYGETWQEFDGNWYSNLLWRRYMASSKRTGYEGWGEGGWGDYVRIKYGDEVAGEAGAPEDEGPEFDLESEDPEAVNRWLEEQARRFEAGA